MKLAISTLVCKDWTLGKTIAVCQQAKIAALELRMGIHAWSKEYLPDSFYEEMYTELHRANIVVCDLATSIVVKNNSEHALTELVRCAQIAQILHCKGLRIMLGNFRTRWSEEIASPDRNGILCWLRAAQSILQEYDTELWIETHNEFATGQSLRRLLEDADIDRCKFIWDIMHPLESGETPAQTIEAMGPHLVHVDLKCGIPWGDPDLASYCYTAMGEGNLPIAAIVTQLQQNGYDGYYSLEWEGIWRAELQEKNFDNEQVVLDFARQMQQFHQ